MKNYSSENFGGKTVLLRTDFDITLQNDGSVRDSSLRLNSDLPTIKALISQGAKIVIIAHRGRPKRKVDPEFTLKPVAEALATRLGREVQNAPLQQNDAIPDELRPGFYLSSQNGSQELQHTANMQPGDIVVLENIRFHPQETGNEKGLAGQLAQIADAYISDAFANLHRKHTSMHALPKLLPSYAGESVVSQTQLLQQATSNPERPFIVVIGGAKAQTKVKIVNNLLGKSDAILLGGIVANTILAAKGIATGASPVDKDLVDSCKDLPLTDTKLHLPVDVITARKTSSQETSIHGVGQIPSNEMILDLGPDTQKLFSNIIGSAKTILWNGTLGYVESDLFSGASKALLAAIKSTNATSIIGGGDTLAFVDREKSSESITHLITGGGAMLEFLIGNDLPGLENISQ